jgi:signal transduction histidine kinase
MIWRRIVSLVWPRPIHLQMQVLIVLAVVGVLTLGGIVEDATRIRDAEGRDPTVSLLRTASLAEFLRVAKPEVLPGILQTAAAAGLPVVLMSAEQAGTLQPPEGGWADLRQWLAFPCEEDRELLADGKYALHEGQLVFVVPVDAARSLVLTGLPDRVIISGILSPLIYQTLALVWLLVMFCIFGTKVITAPLQRIVRALGDTDEFLRRDRKLTEDGSREFSALTGVLNDLRDRIRQLIHNRTRMLRSISHDLRTPLTRLKLRAERLEDSGLREQMLQDLGRIDGMLRLTLDFFRVGSEAEPPEKLDLAVMLQVMADDYADSGQPVRYDGPDHLPAVCRPSGLARAVANLCDNAVKYGGAAALSVRREHGGVAVTVQDTGPGIPETLMDRVLEPFFRADDARTQNADAPSYGLGLSIVDEIVRSHGGWLRLSNQPTGGLMACLWLPDVIPDT